MTFALATATVGPSFAMATQPTIAPPAGYTAADFSMNTVALNLNGLITESAAGAVNPPVGFVRQSPTCTAITSTLVAQARSATVAASQFPDQRHRLPRRAGDRVSVIPGPRVNPGRSPSP